MFCYLPDNLAGLTEDSGLSYVHSLLAGTLSGRCVISLYQMISMSPDGGKMPTQAAKSLLPMGGDVGFPSVCYEYVLSPLVNKEAALAYSRVEYSQAGRDIEKV